MTSTPTQRFDHIVLISLDTLRADGIASNPLRLWPSRFGNLSAPRTDGVDELVRDGCLFANVITSAPYTSASHATYLTGQWPHRHGVYEFFNRRIQSKTIFARAKAAGYRTILKSDFPIILGPHLGFTDDVDEFIIEDDDRFLAALDPNKPSLSLVHFGGIHIPYGFHNLRYGDGDYIRAVEDLEREGDRREGFIGDRLVETYRDPEDLALLIRYKRAIQRRYEEGRFEELFALYLNGIEYFMRRRLEPFLWALRSRLASSDPLIVLFGDHGEEYDDRSYGHFNSLSEGVLRVPVLFFGRGVAAGVHTARIRTIDVGTTILALAFGSPVYDVDGVDLSRTVETGEPYPVREAFAQSYTADTAEFVAFQDRMIASGGKSGLLHHVRYGEAAYLGDFKLTRQSYTYREHGGAWHLQRCEPILTLEAFSDDAIPRPSDDTAMSAALLTMMDRRPSAPRGHRTEGLDIPESVRANLRDMGYAV